MKIKNGFVLEKVGDSYLACATGKLAAEFSGFVRMNETGAFLWNTLDSGNCESEAELAATLASEYGVDVAVVEKDVSAFLEELRNNGILE